MRIASRPVWIGLLVVTLTAAAQAAPAPSALDVWFQHATSNDTPGTVKPMTKPDFLCGTTFKTMCPFKWDETLPDVGDEGIYNLYRYDRKHHVGFAFATTDQRSEALFSAPPPPQSVPDADLSSYRTGRGLRIGSPYSQVLAIYGPPAKHGTRFVTSYSANDIVVFRGKPEQQPERITLVIDHGVVTSIAINLELYEP